MNKELKELLDDIVNDLIYYDLEFLATKDKLNFEGLSALVELRHDPYMERECRLERCKKLIKILEEAEDEE